MFLIQIKTTKINNKEVNMFKIEKPEMVNKTFRLPLELVERLSTVAQNQGISLKYALENLDTGDK